MSSISSSPKSSPLVPYTPPQKHPVTTAKVLKRQKMRAVLAKSLAAQVADQRLHPKTHVPIPMPKCSDFPSKRFNGTRTECLRLVKNTVHRTIDNMDYDGLKPYATIIGQMEKREKPMRASEHMRRDELGPFKKYAKTRDLRLFSS